MVQGCHWRPLAKMDQIIADSKLSVGDAREMEHN